MPFKENKIKSNRISRFALYSEEPRIKVLPIHPGITQGLSEERRQDEQPNDSLV